VDEFVIPGEAEEQPDTRSVRPNAATAKGVRIWKDFDVA
jgi:hypothetical protein